MSDHVLVISVLTRAGANIHQTATGGYTALAYAALRGHFLVVLGFLRAIGDTNTAAKSHLVSRALRCGAMAGHTKVVSALFVAGADANSADESGLTALYLATSFGMNLIA